VGAGTRDCRTDVALGLAATLNREELQLAAQPQYGRLIAAERTGAQLGTKSRTLAFPSLVATLTGMARGGDSNENVLAWSNGSVHAILASSCMDVAASSSESTRPNRRNTVLS
jgi:hypothetical protein